MDSFKGLNNILHPVGRPSEYPIAAVRYTNKYRQVQERAFLNDRLTTVSTGITHEGISIGHIAIDCLMRVQVSRVEVMMRMSGGLVGQ